MERRPGGPIEGSYENVPGGRRRVPSRRADVPPGSVEPAFDEVADPEQTMYYPEARSTDVPTERVAGDPYAAPRAPVAPGRAGVLSEGERTLELREEQLTVQKDLRELGEILVRTEVEEVPGRLEVEAYREEVEVEHVPVGQVVREREAPWEEDGILVVPVYEEQLVVVKRLVLREHLRIRRVPTTETRLYEDTLRRERLVIEDPNNTGLVHEQFPTEQVSTEPGEEDTRARDEARQREEGGFLQNLVRKLQ